MCPVSAGDVTLVLGGVRSGKSRYALQLASGAERVAFLATAEHPQDATAEHPQDDEMRLKIERHRSERPEHWTTIEEPLNLATVLETATDCDLIIVDCLTLFAGKLLQVYENDAPAINQSIDALCTALASNRFPVVLVSNEVGSGVVPAFEVGRRYRNLLGEINQRVAAAAEDVVLMVAGIPLALKGSLRGKVGV